MDLIRRSPDRRAGMSDPVWFPDACWACSIFSRASGNEAPVACPPWIYTNRNRVERLWSRLKERRAVATRYEKTACSFMGVLCMAATMDWLK